MTTPVARTARDDAQNVAGEAKGQAQNVAEEAKGQAQNVADEAKGQVQNVAEEAKQQGRDLAGELQGQLREQSDTQRDRLVSTLRELGQELREMAEGGNRDGLASDLARRASSQVETVTGYLDGRGPGDLIDDVRSYARRRPGMFLLAAGAAGVLAGRATRGVKAASSSSSGSGSTGTTEAYAGTTYPASGYSSPAYEPPYADTGTGSAYANPVPSGFSGTAAGQPVEGVDVTEGRYGSDPLLDPATSPGYGLEPDDGRGRP